MSQFEPVGDLSNKVKCVDCGAQGYDVDETYPHSWKRIHLRGHAPCPRCGRQLPLLISGTHRTHRRCPA